MPVSIIITTRNRCAELEVACRALKRLSPPPEEIIVFADGCADLTLETVRSHLPASLLVEGAKPRGSVFCRDQMLRNARGEIVVSLDDDSYPVQSNFIERVEESFDQHPEADVIAFKESRADEGSPDSDATGSMARYVPAYANCAAAMRRSNYLERPGFPIFFEHMYEEPDYALQCYAAGSAVWYEPSIEIYHHVSPRNRAPLRRHHLNARNELWSVWMRCPLPWLPLISLYRMARQMVYAHSQGWDWLLQEPAWWFAALRGMKQCRAERQPVHWNCYYHWLTLARRPTDSRRELRAHFKIQHGTKWARRPGRSGQTSRPRNLIPSR
jgi:glycosyltransferase involved in cell wall biosynthesis